MAPARPSAAAPSATLSTTVSVPTDTPDTPTDAESTDGSSVDVHWTYTIALNNASGFVLLRATNGGNPAPHVRRWPILS